MGAIHALRRVLGRLSGVPVIRLPLDNLSLAAIGTLTAGGPVGGADDVLAFLEEIREIMTTELPAATDGSTATPEVRA